MRPEKEFLTKEYAARLNASPFFIVVNYKGLHVAHMTELRKRLSKAGAEVHVVKNSIFRIAAKEAGVGELNGALTGQSAIELADSGFFGGDAENRVLNDMHLRAGFREPLAQFGHVGHVQALVIHHDKERGGIEPRRIFLGQKFFFRTHILLKVEL